MGSPWSDLDRPPLSARRLARDLVGHGSPWTEVRVLPETGSTNADAAAAARAGLPEGLVVVAEAQRSGRGRLDRVWTSPPRAGLTLSVLLRPRTPPATWGWLPLLAGLAVRDAVAAVAEVEPRLKWPNDLLLDGRKLAGLLAEAHAGAVVVGVGLNVTTRADELPEGATSLRAAGAEVTDRETLLRALLRALAQEYDAWGVRGGDATDLRPRYVAACATVGSRVRVTRLGAPALHGTATGVDGDGRLVVAPAGGDAVTVSSGDVEHVRAEDGSRG